MKFPKPWFRNGRGWFVTLHSRQIKLGKTKAESLKRYQQLMAQPKQRAVIAHDSLLAIIDAFLDWCQKHRAAGTYEWYRSRLEHFAKKYCSVSAGMRLSAS